MIYVDVKSLKLHPDLALANIGLIKKLKKYLSRSNTNILSFCSANRPYVLAREDHSYQLLSHHHVYLLVKGLRQRGFNANEVTSTSEVDDILTVDRINATLLEKALMSEVSLSGAAKGHQRRRAARQICPLCSGPLIRQKSKKGRIIDGEEMYEVHCHYNEKYYPHRACNFAVLLEKIEFDLFKRNQYPTSRWLQKLGSNCPKCKDDPLYERRMLNGKVFHQCLNTLTGDDSKCSYRVEINE